MGQTSYHRVEYWRYSSFYQLKSPCEVFISVHVACPFMEEAFPPEGALLTCFCHILGNVFRGGFDRCSLFTVAVFSFFSFVLLYGKCFFFREGLNVFVEPSSEAIKADSDPRGNQQLEAKDFSWTTSPNFHTPILLLRGTHAHAHMPHAHTLLSPTAASALSMYSHSQCLENQSSNGKGTSWPGSGFILPTVRARFKLFEVATYM